MVDTTWGRWLGPVTLWLFRDLPCHAGRPGAHGRDVNIEDAGRFRRVYQDAFESMLADARRWVDQPADAANVVAETFLVAWRRDREMPAGGGHTAAPRRRPVRPAAA